MQVIVNADHRIHATRARSSWASAVVADELRHVGDHLTRIEVHLGADSDPAKAPPDVRCVLEARIEGRQPVAVTQHDRSLDQAVRVAARKLHHLVEHAIGRTRRRAMKAASWTTPRKDCS